MVSSEWSSARRAYTCHRAEKYLRVKDIYGVEEFVSHRFKDIQNAGLCAVRLSVTSWPPLVVRWVCSEVSSVDCVGGMVAGFLAP